MAFVVLAEGVYKRTIAATFSRKEAVMPVNFCVSTHTLMPIWRAEKPRLTSWPVRPQSSSTISVLTPSKNQLTIFNQISTSCCSHTITNIRGQNDAGSCCAQRWGKQARCSRTCHGRGRTAGSQGTGSCLNWLGRQ